MHNIIEANRSEIERLCRTNHVRRLWLIGSLVHGDFDPETSDLDFIVEFFPFERQGLSDPFFKLILAFEDLFHRQVDLIEYEAIRNPRFKDEVDRTRVSLYAA